MDKTIQNSWNEAVVVSDEGGIVRLLMRPGDSETRAKYVNLTPEQADELGRTLRAFAHLLEPQESSI